MKPLLLFILILFMVSCTVYHCPNEQAGKPGKPKDHNLNRHVAVANY